MNCDQLTNCSDFKKMPLKRKDFLVKIENDDDEIFDTLDHWISIFNCGHLDPTSISSPKQSLYFRCKYLHINRTDSPSNRIMPFI